MAEPVVIRSLDYLGALAAHHVLGWELCENPDCEGCDALVTAVHGCDHEGGGILWIVKAPANWRGDPFTRQHRSGDPHGALDIAEDVADAWNVVGAMIATGWRLALIVRPDYVEARFARNPRPGPWQRAAEAPAAICRAALEAVGHPVRLELGP